jgi:DNA helicase-2/ATP-dependent DNA helicase PcrA
MAATRLGFGELYSALHDKAPDAFKNGFMDRTAWPLRPFASFIVPLSDAIHNGREFEAMTILRKYCPLLAKEALPQEGVSELLDQLQEATEQLAAMMVPGSAATNRQVLEHLRDQRLLTLDPRILAYLNEQLPPLVDAGELEDEEETGKEIASIDAFLACPAVQFWGYRQYVDEESPFSTQQGIKGAEFPKVLVVADDEVGTHFQFSYDKYFGIKELSDRDEANRREGKETQVERTRRLFYVCCTRALTDLAVVLFSVDLRAAERAIRATDIFEDDQIYTIVDLHYRRLRETLAAKLYLTSVGNGRS